MKKFHKSRKYQREGQYYVFPCKCAGILPEKKKSSVFAAWNGDSNHVCRIIRILGNSRDNAKKGGFSSIDLDTSHSVIRSMMGLPCVYCNKSLDWSKLEAGKTPHLDHDHETGEINGFAHPKCNYLALYKDLVKLRKENKELKRELKNSLDKSSKL